MGFQTSYCSMHESQSAQNGNRKSQETPILKRRRQYIGELKILLFFQSFEEIIRFMSPSIAGFEAQKFSLHLKMINKKLITLEQFYDFA